MNNTDNIKPIYYVYTFFGWFLFALVNIIQFVFFMPIFFVICLFFDRDKRLFSYLTKFFSNVFHFLFFFEKVQFYKNGLKSPKKGEKRIYVVNHASQYDVILMYLLPGPIKFIFKEKWARMPIIGWTASLAGNVILKEDSKAADSLIFFRRAIELMNRGYPFVIYPEGTRSKDGKIGQFFHGTFKLALDGEADIVPVVFDSWNNIRPGALWIRDIRPTIKILEPIKYESFKHLNYVKLSHLVRLRMVEGLISLRNERRIKEKNYYRKIEKFEAIDKDMEKDLLELREYIEKKGISLST
ncbi:MAG TPA: lysophospholipid acyltransferase family protein [Spirochaetota bacterium]|nr:lysophospholipid acyltransferase family protein [Spirochaetota bacterium]